MTHRADCRGDQMRRRDFITALAGATACISAGRAEEPRRVIGLLSSITFDLYPGAEAAIARGLENTGFVEDKNISIIRRSADGQYNRLPSLASELVRPGVATSISIRSGRSLIAAVTPA